MKCRNILVVEDDHSIRLMIKDVLEMNGYRIFTANDGNDGIKKLQSILPEPCIVLLDLMMPGTNGWQFLDIQRNDPQLSAVPIIVCSAYKESALAVNPADFIAKPIQLDTLLEVVKKFSD